MADDKTERTYTLAEASRVSGLSYSTLRRMVDRGDLEADTSNPRRYAIRERNLPRRRISASEARRAELARQIEAMRAEVREMHRKLDQLERERGIEWC